MNYNAPNVDIPFWPFNIITLLTCVKIKSHTILTVLVDGNAKECLHLGNCIKTKAASTFLGPFLSNGALKKLSPPYRPIRFS